jgi:sugar O-acyltransferase (sialic acid O-acetyltransferase NeuD family)
MESIEAAGDIVRCIARNMPSQAYENMRIPIDHRIRGYNFDREAKPKMSQVELTDMSELILKNTDSVFYGFSGHLVLKVHGDLVSRQKHVKLYSLTHPATSISPSVHRGEGTSILAGAIVSSGCYLDDFSRVNKGVIIGHDTTICKCVTIQPGARIGGHCLIGPGSYIGIGATLIQDVTIGENSIVAAGAVVLGEVPPYTLFAGVPARFKKSLPKNNA